MTWRQGISEAVQVNGDSWENLVSITLTEEDLDVDFDAGYGGEEGKPFTVWTKEFVYFPASYDGSEWVASVPRNPCKVATDHVGGG